MKKYIIIALWFASVLIAKAQKITEYKAINGITYKLNDTVRVGLGSGQDGWFVYILPSALNTSDTQRDWFKRKFTNGYVVIKKIEVDKFKRYSFVVGVGAMYNMNINIDAAITKGEVIPEKINSN